MVILNNFFLLGVSLFLLKIFFDTKGYSTTHNVNVETVREKCYG
jgi:hypothetical protein